MNYSELSVAYFSERNQLEQVLIRKALSQQLTQADIEESFTDANQLMEKYYTQLKTQVIDKNAKRRQKYWQKLDKVSGLANLDK